MSMISRCSLGRTIFLRSPIEGEARGTLTFGQSLNSGDSATFNAVVNGKDVTITFTDTQSGATAEVRNFIGHHNSNH